MKTLASVVIVLVGLLLSLTTAVTSKSSTSPRVMTWLCLEFCQESPETIQKNLQQVLTNRDVFDAVSFEKYTLGPNSTLVDNHLTVVSPMIVAMGLEAWPLLSSYPHPPEFIDWMRTVFQNPQPFIDECIRRAHLFKYAGYNLDWEPTDNVTADDGAAYAAFIDTFATQLHAAGLQLTVDVATWSTIWNYPAIAATSMDRAISMGTYTSSDDSFTSQLTKLTSAFGPARSGAGLMTVNASSNDPLPLEEVSWRIASIQAANVPEIDIWSSPVPDEWLPLLRDFKANKPVRLLA
eukprot:gene12891-9222_t